MSPESHGLLLLSGFPMLRWISIIHLMSSRLAYSTVGQYSSVIHTSLSFLLLLLLFLLFLLFLLILFLLLFILLYYPVGSLSPYISPASKSKGEESENRQLQSDHTEWVTHNRRPHPVGWRHLQLPLQWRFHTLPHSNPNCCSKSQSKESQGNGLTHNFKPAQFIVSQQLSTGI